MNNMKKLIRDKYVETIDESKIEYVKVGSDDYGLYLISKLSEEIVELQDTGWTDSEEFADVLEVLFALAKHAGLEKQALFDIAETKKVLLGAFETGLVLNY